MDHLLELGFAGKAEMLGEYPTSLPLCPPQIPRELASD
jgi:hypothetical protein